MFVKLLQKRTYRGYTYDSGSYLEVGDALGRKLISVSAAKECTQREYEDSDEPLVTVKSTKPFNKLNKTELRMRAEAEGVDITDEMTNAEIRSAIIAKREAN